MMFNNPTYASLGAFDLRCYSQLNPATPQCPKQVESHHWSQLTTPSFFTQILRKDFVKAFRHWWILCRRLGRTWPGTCPSPGGRSSWARWEHPLMLATAPLKKPWAKSPPMLLKHLTINVNQYLANHLPPIKHEVYIKRYLFNQS